MRSQNKLAEWEWLQEKRHNDEMEAQDMLAELPEEEKKEYLNSPCRKCKSRKTIRCHEECF